MIFKYLLLLTLLIRIIFESYSPKDPGNKELRCIKENLDLKVIKLISIKISILKVKKLEDKVSKTLNKSVEILSKRNKVPKTPSVSNLKTDTYMHSIEKPKDPKDIKNTENSHDKVIKMTTNKMMHSTNGNRQTKKNKVLKIMQTNTGNGDFGKSQNILKKYVDQHRPDFMIVSEANFKGDETNLDIHFPNYKFEVNLMKNMTKSRLIVLIKKGIDYKRITNYEEDDLSSIWI